MKRRIRIRITFLVGLILLVSNTLLVGLLLYNFKVAVQGFEVAINGELVSYYFDDNFEAYLLIAGSIIAIVATVIGTYTVYLLLGKLLYPLKKVTEHMQQVDRGTLFQPIEVKSDIREVNILISSFNSMNSKMKTMFDNQSHFASYVAHEFRTPLAIILTNLEVYKKQPDVNTDEIISIITDQVTKLSKLVTQILSLVSITRIELKDLIPVNLIMDEVIEDLEGYSREKGVEIEFTTDENVKIETLGSHDLLYQAFFNLVENAIKYNQKNGKVFISIAQNDKNILIDIKDSGKGILQEDREKIFEPFYRGDKISNKNVSGNGIGLAFSKQVFAHHKGDLVLKKCDNGAFFEASLYRYDYILKEGIL